MRHLLLPALCVALAPQAHALIDTNANALSDIWEKAFNANTLFTAANPDHAPTADPDGDGWTNFQEAAAGTNPFDANTPAGFVRPQIAHSPGTYEQSEGTLASSSILIDPPTVTLTWPTLAGKAYQVEVSEGLNADWLPASGGFMGEGDPLSFESENVRSDGAVPSKLFMRVAISDTDSDGDNLTDWEEGRLGTDPYSPDTDRDGIPDGVEIANSGDPLFNHLHLDPDGAGMPAAALASLVAWWDMQPPPGSYGPLVLPSRSADLSGAFHALSQPSGSVSTLSIAGKAISTPSTVPDRIDLLALGQNSSLRSRTSLTLHYWLRLPKEHLTPAVGKTTPLEITLAAYNNVGSEVPNIEWSARRAPNGGTRFLLDQGNRTASTNWFLPGAHDTPRYLDDGRWHHLALVIAGNNTRMWLDGAQIGPNSTNLNSFSIPSNVHTTGGYLRIGGVLRYAQPGVGSPYLASDLIGEVDGVMLHHARLDSPDPLIFQKVYRRDRDNDGLWDVTEAATALWRDANANTQREPGEITYTSSPDEWNPPGHDTDGDGLSDVDEQTRGTDIANPDSDGDLLPDGWEVDNNLDPLISTGVNGGGQGPDTDGVTNLDEYRHNSNPRVNDTDGDGTSDAVEINGPDGNLATGDGSNPADAGDNGQPLPPAERVTILLGVGDQSGSKSEDYVMNVYRIDPETGAEIRFHTHRSGGYGEYKETPVSLFRKGGSYTFQIDWQGTKNSSQPASGTASAEGPDFDYTFKVEPQGAYLGKLIPSWDSATGATDGSALAVTGASNVADTQQEFEENYERRRVALVCPKLEWQAIGGFENLDTHTDPWTNQAKGKRIFPCRKNPNDGSIRHKLRLVATGGLKGVELFVKSFDIDDSTSEAFDADIDTGQPVIDTNTEAGDDNRPDYIQTASAGHFWNAPTRTWGGHTANKTFGADGRAEFDYRVGMQPGNNYRAVASVGDAAGYAAVHVLNDTQPGYLGHELGQDGGAIASEPLTVWRRLWVENDSMAAIPVDQFGYKRNDLSADLTPLVFSANYNAVSARTDIRIPPISDRSSFEALDNGKLIVQSQSHPVLATYVQIPETDNIHHVQIAGDHSGIPQNAGFRVYDDDDSGLNAPPLPRLDLVNETFKNAYKSAFIEVMDAAEYNPRKIVEFYRNHPVMVGAQGFQNPGVWDDAIDLSDSRSLWVGNVVTGYQGNVAEDKDPNTEDAIEGITPGSRKYSVVYVEVIREALDSLFRNPGFDNTQLNQELNKNITLTAAHELGHMPGGGNETSHHDENQLMGSGGYSNADSASISPTTTLRIRNTEKWQQP
jgi:hypothetical protein